MKERARTPLNALAAIGLISAALCALLTLFAIAAERVAGNLAQVVVPALWPVAVVFIAAWLLGSAIVNQLVPERPGKP
jgi:hypothetical protein